MNNWPNIIEEFEINNKINIKELKDKEYYTLMKKHHVNYYYLIEKKAYRTHGIITNGESMKNYLHGMEINKKIVNFERNKELIEKEIIDFIKRENINSTDLEINAVWKNMNIVFIEINNNIHITLK